MSASQHMAPSDECLAAAHQHTFERDLVFRSTFIDIKHQSFVDHSLSPRSSKSDPGSRAGSAGTVFEEERAYVKVLAGKLSRGVIGSQDCKIRSRVDDDVPQKQQATPLRSMHEIPEEMERALRNTVTSFTTTVHKNVANATQEKLPLKQLCRQFMEIHDAVMVKFESSISQAVILIQHFIDSVLLDLMSDDVPDDIIIQRMQSIPSKVRQTAEAAVEQPLSFYQERIGHVIQQVSESPIVPQIGMDTMESTVKESEIARMGDSVQMQSSICGAAEDDSRQVTERAGRVRQSEEPGSPMQRLPRLDRRKRKLLQNATAMERMELLLPVARSKVKCSDMGAEIPDLLDSLNAVFCQTRHMTSPEPSNKKLQQLDAYVNWVPVHAVLTMLCDTTFSEDHINRQAFQQLLGRVSAVVKKQQRRTFIGSIQHRYKDNDQASSSFPSSES